MNEPSLEAFQADILKVPDVELRMKGYEAWAVFALLQLAIRHPGHTDHAAAMGRRIARRLQQQIAITDVLRTVAEMGWQNEQDPDDRIHEA